MIFRNKSLNVLGSVAVIANMGFSTAVNAAEVDVDFGGYVKLDATVSSNGGSAIHDATGILNVDLALLSEDADTRFDMSAKQTTLNVTVTKGDVKAFVEGNFYGEGSFGNFAESSGLGSYDFILRHAYIETGSFLFGQTWSVFTDLNGLIEMADFNLAAGTVWARTPQIRYTYKSGPITFLASLENPGLDIGAGDIDGQSRPDVAARVDFDGDFGHFSIAGIARAIESDRSPLNGSEVDDDETGSGFSATAKIPLGKSFNAIAQYAKGDLGYHVGLTGYADAEAISATELRPLEIDGMSFALNANWSDKVRSNILYSKSSVSDGTNPVGIDESESLHINTWFQYSDNVTFGIEYQQREATLNDGTRPDLDRVGFHALMSF